MIGKIRGKLLEINDNIALIETASGLSYEVYLPPSLLTVEVNKNIEIYTFLRVTDDSHTLFGFKTRNDKELFESLLKISGVGAKTAFSVVSFGSEDEIVNAVRNNDVEYFTRVPGLGKKTSMKVILELSQKLNTQIQLSRMILSQEDTTVIDALTSLGFKSQEARQIFSKISKHLSIEEKIKEALRIGTKRDV